MPGIGPRTGARILAEIGDGSGFASGAKLAAYAGLAPVTRQSGTSLNAETRSRRGNHRLKNAMFLAAFASLRDPASKAFYDRKRAEGKRHNAALICLARRRCDVILAMLRNRQPYQPDRAQAARGRLTAGLTARHGTRPRRNARQERAVVLPSPALPPEPRKHHKSPDIPEPGQGKRTSPLSPKPLTRNMGTPPASSNASTGHPPHEACQAPGSDWPSSEASRMRTTAPSRYRWDRTGRHSHWRSRRSRAPSKSRPASGNECATATSGPGPARRPP